MKQRNLLLGLIVGILLFSCSSDDGNEPLNNEVSILGVWRLTGVSSSDTGTSQLTDCERLTRLTFLENSTADFKEFYIENNDCLEDNYTVEYTIDSNVLSFTSNGATNNFTFILTATTLSYSQSENGITNTTSWQKTQ